MDEKILKLLGLCKKAGYLISGESGCEKALKNGSARLVVIAGTASENTKKKFVNKSFYYNVPCRLLFTKEILSKAIGENNRSAVVVTDGNLAASIAKYIDIGFCEAEKPGKT